jgi:hypothetical protein
MKILQKCLMASSVRRIVLDKAATATMLTRLFAAIANIDAAWDGRTFAREECRFGLDRVRFAAMEFLE